MVFRIQASIVWRWKCRGEGCWCAGREWERVWERLGDRFGEHESEYEREHGHEHD